MLKLLVMAIVLLTVSPAGAIVVRDDRDDARYLGLGARYPAAVRIIPDGSGVLIAPDWVLTAAHVAHGVARRSPRVEVGGAEIEVSRVLVHDGWRDMGPHDIALMKLVKPVAGIDPVGLYSLDDEVGRMVTFVGTGDTGTGLTGPKRMDGKKRGATNTVESADDDWIFFTFDRGDEATDLEGVSGPGDSGGPALVERDGKLYTVGVSVFSDGEGKGPGRYGVREGYTRVSTHRRWIRSVLAGEESGREIEIGVDRQVHRKGPGGGGRAVVVSGSSDLPDSPFGRVIGKYVEAFNSDSNDKMSSFIADHFAEEFRASKSEQEHLDLYRRLYDEHFGKITPRHVVRNDETGLTVLFDTAKGKSAEFRFEVGQAERVAGMRVGIVEVSRD